MELYVLNPNYGASDFEYQMDKEKHIFQWKKSTYEEAS